MNELVTDAAGSAYFEPMESWLWAGFVTLVFGALVLLVARRWSAERRVERAGRGELAEAAALTPSRAARVVGDVEFARGATCAVRLELWLAGVERRSRNGFRHSWRELRRELSAQPFYLRLAGGERVYVEPGSAPVLMSVLEQGAAPDEDAQQEAHPGALAIDLAVAELSPGERVVASGELLRGADPEGAASYRDGGAGWVMRAPTGGPLRLMTPRVLDQRRARARRLGAVTLFLAAVAALAQLPLATFYARAAFGQPRVARVERTYERTARARNGRRVGRHTAARCLDGTCFVDAPLEESFADRGARIWVYDGPGGAIFGRRNALFGPPLIAEAVLLLVALLGAWVAWPRRHWWDLDHFEEQGAGRIPRVAERERAERNERAVATLAAPAPRTESRGKR